MWSAYFLGKEMRDEGKHNLNFRLEKSSFYKSASGQVRIVDYKYSVL